MKRLVLAICIIALAIMACRLSPSEPRQLNLYPTDTPEITQTAFVVEITTTPIDTPLPMVVQVTPTPTTFCVNALVAVYLRPSPGDDNYPILPLPNGSQLSDLGGRNDNWLFVEYRDKQGWVHSDYVSDCR